MKIFLDYDLGLGKAVLVYSDDSENISETVYNFFTNALGLNVKIPITADYDKQLEECNTIANSIISALGCNIFNDYDIDPADVLDIQKIQFNKFILEVNGPENSKLLFLANTIDKFMLIKTLNLVFSNAKIENVQDWFTALYAAVDGQRKAVNNFDYINKLAVLPFYLDNIIIANANTLEESEKISNYIYSDDVKLTTQLYYNKDSIVPFMFKYIPSPLTNKIRDKLIKVFTTVVDDVAGELSD